MFENYDYIPGTLIPCNTPNYIPPQGPITRPLEFYNAKGDFAGYTWTYGDSICLEFQTTGEVIYDDTGAYESVDQYFEGKQLQLLIFDFRYIAVVDKTIDASSDAVFVLDQTDIESLVRGKYTFQLILIDNTNQTTYTLMPQSGDVCTIYIK